MLAVASYTGVLATSVLAWPCSACTGSGSGCVIAHGGTPFMLQIHPPPLHAIPTPTVYPAPTGRPSQPRPALRPAPDAGDGARGAGGAGGARGGAGQRDAGGAAGRRLRVAAVRWRGWATARGLSSAGIGRSLLAACRRLQAHLPARCSPFPRQPHQPPSPSPFSLSRSTPLPLPPLLPAPPPIPPCRSSGEALLCQSTTDLESGAVGLLRLHYLVLPCEGGAGRPPRWGGWLGCRGMWRWASKRVVAWMGAGWVV